MKQFLLICTAAICLSVSPTMAQDAAVKKIIEMGQNDNQVMHHLDILTNRFGGRLVGSDAFENAAEWIIRELRVGDWMWKPKRREAFLWDSTADRGSAEC